MAKIKNIKMVAFVSVCVLFCTNITEAQQRYNRAASRYLNRFGTRQNRPTTSPYLNLLGAGRTGGTAFNYYQRVRPEQEFRRNNANFRRSLGNVQQELRSFKRQLQSPRSGLSSTGHRTSFLNFGSYFGSNFRR